MKSAVTIKLKIPMNKLLLDTMKQYSKVVQYIADIGYKSNIQNRYKLHHLCYYEARKRFNLPSQFIINANRIASQTLKSVKTNKGSKPIFKEYMPLDFDRRTFNFNLDNIRLTTINKRIDIPIKIPEYYTKYLDWRYQTAQIIKTKKGLFIHIIFSRDIAIPSSSSRLHGIDVGINNIAVTSNRQFFNSKKIKYIKIKYRYLRNRLQSKGTKSAKRLLKKISGRERRFMRQCNHEISKTIVSLCNIGDTIIMEKLKNMKGCRVNREQRYWLNNWSYFQLHKFIEYKARLNRCNVIYVNPYRTSKTCSRCGSINTRRISSDFHCLNCSYHLNADLNASFNLRLLGMSLTTKVPVTEPYSSSVDCEAILNGTEHELRTKCPML